MKNANKRSALTNYQNKNSLLKMRDIGLWILSCGYWIVDIGLLRLPTPTKNQSKNV